MVTRVNEAFQRNSTHHPSGPAPATQHPRAAAHTHGILSVRFVFLVLFNTCRERARDRSLSFPFLMFSNTRVPASPRRAPSLGVSPACRTAAAHTHKTTHGATHGQRAATRRSVDRTAIALAQPPPSPSCKGAKRKPLAAPTARPPARPPTHCHPHSHQCHTRTCAGTSQCPLAAPR